MEDKKSLTRKHILTTAFECFSQYGFAKTTFKDVAVRAGLSRALIYLYFKNKEDLFMIMHSERYENYTRLSQKVLETNLSKKEKIRKIIDVWLIDPYRIVNKSPQPNTWLDQLKSVTESEMRFRSLFIDSLAPLLGKEVATFVVLAYRGLLDDRPAVTVLEKRTRMLIEMVLSNEKP